MLYVRLNGYGETPHCLPEVTRDADGIRRVPCEQHSVSPGHLWRLQPLKKLVVYILLVMVK